MTSMKSGNEEFPVEVQIARLLEPLLQAHTEMILRPNAESYEKFDEARTFVEQQLLKLCKGRNP